MKNCNIIILLFLSFAIHAQQSIDVTVIDQSTKEQLAFANVYLKNNEIGNATNLNGMASLKLPENAFQNDTLVCSFIGYETVERVVKNLFETSSLEIQLKSKEQWVSEVVVNETVSNLIGSEIIEKAIKNIKQNYPRKPINMEAFYRELTYENKRCILLSEAATSFYYTPYPRKRYVKKSFRQYYKDDYGYMNGDNGVPTFLNPQYFKYYNSVKDLCKIDAIRLSQSWSKHQLEPSGNTGPLGLTAIDKVKYLADFLDPKLQGDYEFKKQGAVYVGSRLCFVVSFKPKRIGDKVRQQWNWKIRFPLYAGKIYIDTESFAVTKFDCQFSKSTDFGWYGQEYFFASSTNISCQYQEIDGVWYLDRIRTEQLLKEDARSTILPTDQRFVRELVVNSIEKENVVSFQKEDPLLLKDIRYGKLRSMGTAYNLDFWEKYMAEGKVVSLDPPDKEQLESRVKLIDQFQNQYIQRDLPPPLTPLVEDTIFAIHGIQLDGYTYLENPSDSLTMDYLERENIYFDNFMIPLREKRKLAYAKVVNKISYCDTLRKKPEPQYGVGRDYFGSWGVWKINKKERKENILPLYKRIGRGFKFISFKMSSDGTKIAYILENIKSEHRILKVERIADKKTVATIKQVNDIYWFNNEILLFSENDHSKRIYRFSSFDFRTDEITYLIQTEDREHELEFYFADLKEHYLIVDNRSSEDNNVFVISLKMDKPALKLLHDSKTFFSEKMRIEQSVCFALARSSDGITMIYSASLDDEKVSWEKIITPNEGELFDEFIPTKKYFAVKTINNGLIKAYAFDRVTKERKEIKLPEKHHSVSFGGNYNFNQNKCTIYYSTPTVPIIEYQIDLDNFDMDLTPIYCFNDSIPPVSIETKLIMVPAEDNVSIPLRISFAPEVKGKKKGTILIGYGAYGAFQDADYDEYFSFLMEEGYTIAHAHVRGGRAKNWKWYKQGKLLKKKNSFEDYLSCTRFLIENNYADSTQQLIAYGQSAGGLIVGAAINQEPSLFKAAILDYPYLDVINTMLKDSLPLTTLEYQEWGNPNDKESYDYMMSYSPYQNIKSQNYPNILLLTGMKDFQTPYWQCMKSVAKYRNANQGNSSIIVRINPHGHPGSIPYQQRILDMVYQYLFLEGI